MIGCGVNAQPYAEWTIGELPRVFTRTCDFLEKRCIKTPKPVGDAGALVAYYENDPAMDKLWLPMFFLRALHATIGMPRSLLPIRLKFRPKNVLFQNSKFTSRCPAIGYGVTQCRSGDAWLKCDIIG